MKRRINKFVSVFLFALVAVFAFSITTVSAQEHETYKFTSYTTTETSGTFWYENEANAFTVDGELWTAFLDGLEVAAAIEANGAPVWGTDAFLITTKRLFTLSEGVVTEGEGIGFIEVAEAETVLGQEFTDEVKEMIIDSFADAYLFAYDRGGHDLGAPVGEAYIITGFDNDEALVQDFEDGKIVMSRYQRPAVPIYGKMLTAWEDDFGLLGEEGIGAPISRQFNVGDVTYQNFRFGWAKLENDVVTMTFSPENEQIDYNGKPANGFVGYFENRANVSIGHEDFGHELLRTHESYMRAYSEATASGFTLYRGGIREGHEWNGFGLTQGYPAGDSTANPWGQSSFSIIIMESPYHEAQVVRNAILDQYSTKGNDQPGTLGFPTGPDFGLAVDVDVEDTTHTVDVSFQNFNGGYIRTYLVGFNIIAEEYAGFYVDENGLAYNSETDELTDHPYDLSGLEEEEPIDEEPIDEEQTQVMTLQKIVHH